MNVLIVDDQPMNLKVLRAQLEAEGFSVVEAADGLQALEALGREKIDAIISDILMPRMDGYRLCYEVRKSERWRSIPFIMYTATYTSPSDEKLSLDLGADKYLKKPASSEEMLEALRGLTGGGDRPSARLVDFPDEIEVMHEYSERLVAKLEQKNVELRQANGELQAREARLLLQATALDTAANAILITDVDGIIQWVNPAFTTVTGFTAEEALGKTPRIVKSGRHDQAFYHDFWKTIRSGQTWRGEFTNRRKDGALYYDEHTVTPVRGPDGAITNYVGIMHDVTERKRAEQAWRETQCFLEKAQQVGHTGSWMSDPDLNGNVIWSAETHRIFGFGPAEFDGKVETFLALVHPEDRETVRQAARAAIAGERPYSLEHRILRRDGQVRWVRELADIERDADGRPVRMIGVVHDITDQKRADESFKLRAAELERFHRLSVGREIQMIDLKKEVNELAKQLGRLPPYDISFLDRAPSAQN